MAKNTNLVMMFGQAHGRYLMGRKTLFPDVEDDDDGHHARSALPVAKDKTMTDDPHSRMDESGQGPRRAVAIVVAHLLRIQPGIHSLQIPPQTGHGIG